MRKRPLIAVSGGFDPVHIGHVRMIRDALQRKKGYVFMPYEQRAEIMGNIKGVTLITSVDDSDGTVCQALKRHKPDAFANGGDRKTENTPEMDVCEELGIQLMWAVGGSNKPQSSSWLVDKLKENKNGRK